MKFTLSDNSANITVLTTGYLTEILYVKLYTCLGRHSVSECVTAFYSWITAAVLHCELYCSGNVYAVFDHVLIYFSLAVVVILTYWFNALIYHFTPFFMTLLCNAQQKIFIKSGLCP